jgi:Glycerol kinase
VTVLDHRAAITGRAGAVITIHRLQQGDDRLPRSSCGGAMIRLSGHARVAMSAGLIAGERETEALAPSPPPNEGVCFVLAPTAVGAARRNPCAGGSVMGLTRWSAGTYLFRVAVQAMAYRSRDVVDAMALDCGMPLATQRRVGGVPDAGVLRRRAIEYPRCVVEVPDVAAATALGAAHLTGHATDHRPDVDEPAANWCIARRTIPFVSADDRARLYGRWKKAVERGQYWAQADATTSIGSPRGREPRRRCQAAMDAPSSRSWRSLHRADDVGPSAPARCTTPRPLAPHSGDAEFEVFRANVHATPLALPAQPRQRSAPEGQRARSFSFAVPISWRRLRSLTPSRCISKRVSGSPNRSSSLGSMPASA